MISNSTSHIPSGSSIPSSKTNHSGSDHNGSGTVRASDGKEIPVTVSFGTNKHPTSPETNVSGTSASPLHLAKSVCRAETFTSKTFNKLDETQQTKLIQGEAVMEQKSTRASDLTHGEAFMKTRPTKMLGGAYELLPTFHAYKLVNADTAENFFQEFSSPPLLGNKFPIFCDSNKNTSISDDGKNTTLQSTFKLTPDPASLISQSGFLKDDTIKIAGEVKEDAGCKTVSYVQDEQYAPGTKVESTYLRKVEASLTIEPHKNDQALVHFKLFFDPRAKAALDVINTMDGSKFSQTENAIKGIFDQILGVSKSDN